MDKLTGVLRLWIGKSRNEYIKLRGVKKGIHDKCVLKWFNHMERIADSRLVKGMYSECVLEIGRLENQRKSGLGQLECLKTEIWV